jgi:hypothetical protein
MNKCTPEIFLSRNRWSIEDDASLGYQVPFTRRAVILNVGHFQRFLNEVALGFAVLMGVIG